jgi:gamma-glutamylcyclotransferase (GGCT)/AIG2-like uncharacterized protein YtfP
MLKVFVYGTLKPGERNYHSYCAPVLVAVQLAIAYGKLYDLPMGYPAAVFPASHFVRGYLLEFSQTAVLQDLDELEDYHPHQPHQNLYQRHQIEVYDSNLSSLGKVWTYSMSLQQINSYGGVFVSDGWWTSKK